MMPVSGPIPECSTRKLFAASCPSVTALYAGVMGKKKISEDGQVTEFEELVAAALKVDPKGLSGKHVKSTGTIPEGIEAVLINQVLYSKGFSPSQATDWWDTASPDLDGSTPHRVWLSEESVSPKTKERVLSTARATLARSL